MYFPVADRGKKSPDIEFSCECIKRDVTDSRRWVTLLLKVWMRDWTFLTGRKTACSNMVLNVLQIFGLLLNTVTEI